VGINAVCTGAYRFGQLFLRNIKVTVEYREKRRSERRISVPDTARVPPECAR
jgi:hypothetical protein